VAPLSAGELALAIGAGSLVLWLIELEKWLTRQWRVSRQAPDQIV
jgi:hypothetical protein